MDEQNSRPQEPDFEKLAEELGFGAMDADAVQMYELFTSLQKAGFKDKHALYLVATLVSLSNDDDEIHFYPIEGEDSEES
jgi:hypothetical protein